MAVFTLPEEMIGFYKEHIDYLTEHAVDADKRRYALKNEFSRHYIDIDHWDTLPFTGVPRKLYDALYLYGEFYCVDGVDSIKLDVDSMEWNSLYHNYIYQERFSTEILIPEGKQRVLIHETMTCNKLVFKNKLVDYGVLPYFLEEFQQSLIRAFKSGDSKSILRLSADLGHYLGDAHVPLHTTVNYNGQLTQQYGIHAFWESRLPELFAEKEYDFLVGSAVYISDYRSYIWEIITESHSLLEELLNKEKQLQYLHGTDEKFCYDWRLQSLVKTECRKYADDYHTALNGMVEKRMRDAIIAIGNMWYSAWVDSGQPDLMLNEKTKIDTIENADLNTEYVNRKIFGRKHNDY